MQDQTILEHNPAVRPIMEHNPAPRPGQFRKTKQLHDQTIRHDTFERLKFSQLNTAYSQTRGLIITDGPVWLQVGRFRNGLKRLRIKADILQL